MVVLLMCGKFDENPVRVVVWLVGKRAKRAECIEKQIKKQPKKIPGIKKTA